MGRKEDKMIREKIVSREREESGVVEESQDKHMSA